MKYFPHFSLIFCLSLLSTTLNSMENEKKRELDGPEESYSNNKKPKIEDVQITDNTCLHKHLFLLSAAHANCLECLERLYTSGLTDLNVQDYQRNSLLRIALNHKNKPMIEWLLKHGASHHNLGDNFYNKSNDIEFIKWFINQPTIDVKSFSENVHLDLFKSNNAALLSWLIDKKMIDLKAFVECFDKEAFIELAVCGNITFFETVLKSSKFTVNEIDDHQGKTPLHHAAANNQLEMVKFLLNNNAQTDIQDKEGNTPLHKAAHWGHIEIVQYFLVSNHSYAEQFIMLYLIKKCNIPTILKSIDRHLLKLMIHPKYDIALKAPLLCISNKSGMCPYDVANSPIKKLIFDFLLGQLQ